MHIMYDLDTSFSFFSLLRAAESTQSEQISDNSRAYMYDAVLILDTCTGTGSRESRGHTTGIEASVAWFGDRRLRL